MKILFCVSWYNDKRDNVIEVGGFHYNQAIDLKKYCDVAIYYPYDKSLTSNFVKDVECGILVYRSRKMSGLLQYYRSINDFIKIYKDFKPDVIHAHCAEFAGVIAVIVGKLFNIPVIVTEHRTVDETRFDKFRVKKKIEYVYKNTIANICVSDFLTEGLSIIYPEQKFTTIFNGTVTDISVDDNIVVTRKTGRTEVCIVGGFYSKNIKGYQYLLPAIKKLIDTGVDIFLHIIGSGEYQGYYESLSRKLQIEEYLKFYGQCSKEKVYSIISQVDFGISASIKESAGIAVQEFLLFGKPVVVTKSGGANSLVNEDVGIIVEKADIDALVNGIRKMILTIGEYNSEKIKNYAYMNFDMKVVTKKYVDLYNDVLKE